jgi:hypothetical protein
MASVSGLHGTGTTHAREVGAAQALQRRGLERVELQIDLELRMLAREPLDERRVLRDAQPVGVQHQVADRPRGGLGEDIEELRMQRGLAPGDLHDVRLALARDDRVEHRADLVERPVQRAPRAGLRVADRALEVAVLVDLDERQARVLHVVGTQPAVVRAAVGHRGREAIGQLGRLDPRLAARAVVRGVVAHQHALGAVSRAPLVHVHALAAHDDLRLHHVQAFAADARGRVVEEIRAGLAGHRSPRAARTTSGR